MSDQFNLTFEEFQQVSQQGNIIPLALSIDSGEETPISAFAKLRQKNSFLLESAEKDNILSRYSFIGISSSNPIEGNDNPYPKIEKILKQFQPVTLKGLPPFHGGLVGYFSYETVEDVEKIKMPTQKPFEVPKASFMLSESCLAFDHREGKIYIIHNIHIDSQSDLKEKYEEASQKNKSILETLKNKKSHLPPLRFSEESDLSKVPSNCTPSQYKQMVEKAKEYIKAGDIFQVVLSQRFEVDLQDEPFDIYRKLRKTNPSPYMFFLQFDSHYLIGTSPRSFSSLSK